MFLLNSRPGFRLPAVVWSSVALPSCHAVKQLGFALPSSSPSSFASSPNSREAMAMAGTIRTIFFVRISAESGEHFPHELPHRLWFDCPLL